MTRGAFAIFAVTALAWCPAHAESPKSPAEGRLMMAYTVFQKAVLCHKSGLSFSAADLSSVTAYGRAVGEQASEAGMSQKDKDELWGVVGLMVSMPVDDMAEYCETARRFFDVVEAQDGQRLLEKAPF